MSAERHDQANELDTYFALPYSLHVRSDPEGGYVLEFPDLPGCMTQVNELHEVSAAAEEIKQLWIESALRQGMAIPQPTYPAEHSGKFNVRLPKSLHRRLAEAAQADDVSLNQHVVAVLSAGMASSRLTSALADLTAGQERMEQALSTLTQRVEEIHMQVSSSRVVPFR